MNCDETAMEEWGPRGKGHPFWRGILYLAALFVAGILYGILAVLLTNAVAPGALSPESPDGGPSPLPAVLLLALTVGFVPLCLLVTHLFLRRGDHCSWRCLFWPWPSHPVRQLLWGTLLAGGLLAAVVALVPLGGAVRSIGPGSLLDRSVWEAGLLLLFYVGGFFLQGGAEEVIFRGYVYRQLGLWRGHGTALVGSALVFSFAHFLNPHGGILAFGNTAAVGLLLGLIRIRFSLWFAIGFHAAWNLLMGLTSLTVSGFALPGLVAIELRGNRSWSGGAYGLEASVPVTLVILAGIFALLIDGRLRRALRRPGFTPRVVGDSRPAATRAQSGIAPDPDHSP